MFPAGDTERVVGAPSSLHHAAAPPEGGVPLHLPLAGETTSRATRLHLSLQTFRLVFLNRPRGNRPRGNRLRGNRPRSNRPRGNRPRSNRPCGNRSRGNLKVSGYRCLYWIERTSTMS